MYLKNDTRTQLIAHAHVKHARACVFLCARDLIYRYAVTSLSQLYIIIYNNLLFNSLSSLASPSLSKEE